MRKMKNIIHIFVDEDTSRDSFSCEVNYFNYVFKRKMCGNWRINTYKKKDLESFIDDLKDAKKEHKKDLFYVLFDIDYNNKGNNSNEYNIKAGKIQKLFKKLDRIYANHVNFIISSRCWEVWLCMYNTIYSKPFTTQDALNKDVDKAYKKKKEWYKRNSEYLFKNAKTAVKNSENSRKLLNVDEKLLDFSDKDSIVHFLNMYDGSPFTFVDEVVKKIMEVSQ